MRTDPGLYLDFFIDQLDHKLNYEPAGTVDIHTEVSGWSKADDWPDYDPSGEGCSPGETKTGLKCGSWGELKRNIDLTQGRIDNVEILQWRDRQTKRCSEITCECVCNPRLEKYVFRCRDSGNSEIFYRYRNVTQRNFF